MRHRNKQQGFTILEILISLLILAGGLSAVAKFQVYSLGSVSAAKQTTEAVMLGQEKLDLLRGYVDLAGYTAIASGADKVDGSNTAYTRTWTVLESTTPSFKSIEMRVDWSDKDGTVSTIYINGVVPGISPGDSGSLHG